MTAYALVSISLLLNDGGRKHNLQVGGGIGILIRKPFDGEPLENPPRI